MGGGGGGGIMHEEREVRVFVEVEGWGKLIG